MINGAQVAIYWVRAQLCLLSSEKLIFGILFEEEF